MGYDAYTTEAEAIDLLIANEEKLSDLYRLYAEQFAEPAGFWTKLAMDEMIHSRWLQSLKPRLRSADIWFRDNRFRPDLYLTFFDYLKQRIVEMKMSSITMFAALSVALDAENTFVEKAYFDIFTTEDPESLRILKALTDACTVHRDHVRAVWEDYRPKGK